MIKKSYQLCSRQLLLQVLCHKYLPKQRRLNVRGTSIIKAEADIIIERALGVYKGQLPGNVEIWTKSGVYRW